MWGFVLAAVALVAGILHQVSYLVALVFQYTAEVPGSVAMDPVEPLILLLYGVATALLFRSEHTISAACRHDLSAPDTDGDEDAIFTMVFPCPSSVTPAGIFTVVPQVP